MQTTNPVMARHSGVLTSRRGVLKLAGGLSVAVLAGLPRRATAALMAKVLETKVIRRQPEYYHGWPTVARRANGELWVTWSGGREHHVCPFGQVLAMTSRDDGKTWSARLPTIVNSPHGPIQLKDGRLLYAGKQLWTDEKKIGVCESRDDGQTWKWLAEIPTRKGDVAARGYHELHAVEANDGKIIAQIRNHNKADASWTLQTESADGGKTWSEPHPICYGLPSHLLKLRDGRLLMTYGHRRKPFGNQARLSTDNGKTWGEAMIVSGDGMGGDLGYPSTIELPDGALLTVWYEAMKDPRHAVLRQARWVLS